MTACLSFKFIPGISRGRLIMVYAVYEAKFSLHPRLSGMGRDSNVPYYNIHEKFEESPP